MLNAKDLMVSGAAFCSPGEDLRAAAQRMRERDCGVLPVLDDHREVVGVLTDRDVAFAAIDQDEPLRSIPVERAMSTEVRALSTGADVNEIHRVMRQFGIRRVPIVDDEQKLIGIVSIDDLASRAARDHSEEGATMSRMLVNTFARLAERHTARIAPSRPML